MNFKKIMLNFLGGEPTLYDELPNKVKEIKKLNLDNRILITTNGSRSFKYLRELAKYAEISFSVHLHQLSLDKLADKINNLSVFNDIQPFQVHIIYPSDSVWYTQKESKSSCRILDLLSSFFDKSSF